MKKLIIANWKMNMTASTIDAWFQEFSKHVSKLDLPKVTIGIAPSFPHLAQVKSLVSNVEVVAQDVSSFPLGAYTSQVSAVQLKDFCKYALVGHSETQATPDISFTKALNCMKENIIPVTCVSDLSAVSKVPAHMFNSVIALEDITDISHDGVYKEVSIESVQLKVDSFTKKFGSDFLGLLYGGSVNRQNASELGKIVGLTGLLVGNASLDAGHFVDIVSDFAQI